MQSYYFSLNISSDEYLRYYKGEATHVMVYTYSGHRLSFPARNLREFIALNGIHGEFCIKVDNNNRMISLELIKDSSSYHLSKRC